MGSGEEDTFRQFGRKEKNMEKLIMTFQIFADNSQVSNMSGPYGAVTIIPFTGKVESELFIYEIPSYNNSPMNDLLYMQLDLSI